MFANTGREMPETLDFVHECEEKWGVSIVCRLSTIGLTEKLGVTDYANKTGKPETLIKAKKYLPNIAARF